MKQVLLRLGFDKKVFIDCVYKPCEFLVRAENASAIRHVLNRIFNRNPVSTRIFAYRMYCIT